MLQDEITIKIIDVMQIKLIYGEQARMWSDSTNNILAYDMNMRGADCFFRINKKDNKQAQYFFKKAISMDEKYAFAYAMLGFTHVLDLLYGWSESPIKSFEEAHKAAEEVLRIDPNFSLEYHKNILPSQIIEVG